MKRYAIYAAPDAGSDLWRFGCSVIGYDALTGSRVPFPSASVFANPDFISAQDEPARYGFHATVKPPFRMALDLEGDNGERQLRYALASFASRMFPLSPVYLAVAELGRFVALVPEAPWREVEEFAAACVEEFEPFRAPLTEAEYTRRKPHLLSERQRSYLERHGYPYVMDEFRFHMTLTGPLPGPLRGEALTALQELYRAAASPFTLDALCLFMQEAAGKPFRLVSRYRLGQNRPGLAG